MNQVRITKQSSLTHKITCFSKKVKKLIYSVEIDGLKRKLSNKLSAADDDSYRNQWNVGECIGTWWKSDFETIPYPYLPSSGKNPKVIFFTMFLQFSIDDDDDDMQECIKLYIVKLPSSKDFVVPKNLKLLAVPLCQLHENRKV